MLMPLQAEHVELLARSAGGRLASSSGLSADDSLTRVEVVSDDSTPASRFHERTTAERLLVSNPSFTPLQFAAICPCVAFTAEAAICVPTFKQAPCHCLVTPLFAEGVEVEA